MFYTLSGTKLVKTSCFPNDCSESDGQESFGWWRQHSTICSGMISYYAGVNFPCSIVYLAGKTLQVVPLKHDGDCEVSLFRPIRLHFMEYFE